MKKKKISGFTLIEILVTIAIIGILATIILVSLNAARVRARDARRDSDLRKIFLAMEMWYDSNESSYCLPGPGATNCDWPDDDATACSGAIGGMIAEMPSDPGGGTYYCSDFGEIDGQTYCVWAQLEVSSDYVLVNKNGTKHVSAAPTDMDTCNQ